MVTNSTNINNFYYLRKKESSKLYSYGKRKYQEKAHDQAATGTAAAESVRTEPQRDLQF